MDNRKIEQNAVTAVRLAFSDVENVLPHLDENDKTECTDGYLQLYSSRVFTVDTVLGQLPVQVKGTASKRKGDAPKRSVRIADLKHYLNVAGGCIYFVVYCGRDALAPEVFYRLLLPYDLKGILAEASDGQRSVALRFNRLPNDSKELTRLVTRAVKDKTKQQGSAGIAMRTHDDYKKANVPLKECEFDIDLFAGEEATSLAPYKHGVYIYGKTAWGEVYPIDKLENVVGVAAGFKCTVSSGDVSYKTSVFNGEDEDGEHTFFRGFDLRYSDKNLSLKETGTLSERIEDLSLMKAMAETGSLCINGHEFARGVNASMFDMDSLNHRLDCLKLIKRVVDALHLKTELDVSALTEQDLRTIDAVNHGIVEGNLLHYENRQSGFARVNFCGHTIKLVFSEEETDMYRMSDALQLEDRTFAVYTYGPDEANREIVAPLLVLTSEEYKIIENIDANVFKSALAKFPITETSANYANNKMLEMLSAYDNGACCAEDLLRCCGVLVEALREFTDEETALINECQIAARSRKLTDEERDALARVQMESSSIPAKACAAALRGDREMALTLIHTMHADDQAAFDTWPIMRFLR